ncbi:MAG: hypothetical protein LUC92_08680 [Clostridiales bacterium]|nr:hypothetical protein [Clostridiales bacterium]
MKQFHEEDSDDTYISKAENGCKDMQRAQFLTYQEPYFSGMYEGSYALSSTNLMTMRSNPPASSTDTYAAVKPTQTINLTAYAKGYYITGAEQNTKFKQKLDKGETVDFDMSSYGSFDNTPLYVYNAGLVQALAGLEALYIGDNGFAAGKRLRSLTVGSLVDGYANTKMTNLSISGNTLLETLIAPNLTAIEGGLDLSNMLLLRYLETRGSTFTSYKFATAGKLEEAYINKPVELHMNNLNKLTNFTIDDFSALTTVEIDSCLTDSGSTDKLLDSLTIIQNAVAAGTLVRIRLIDVYWVFGSTEAEISAATALLDALIKLAGIDENGNDVSASVLTGYIFIPTLKQSEEEKYIEAWGSDLTLDCTDYVYQYSSKFYSDFDDDGNPTGLLGTHYVNQGDGDYAPINAGEIETPTKDSDDKYDYAFKQWYCVTDEQYYEDSDTATWASHIDSDRIYVADYTATYREFEVSFYNTLVSTTEPICTATASYGEEVVFDYDTYGYPEYTAAESSLNFYLFKGWDKSTGFVTENLKVSALWETVSGNPDKNATNLGLVDLYRIGSPVYASTIGNYISGGTRFKYVMGNDYEFDNIDSFEPVAVGDEVYFDGDADEPENLPYIVIDDDGNEIHLFAEDAPSFTLAIDFEMTGADLTRTILSCGDLRIRTYVTTSGSANPQVYWGSVYQSFNFGTQRNMLVIRHEAGSSDINLYLFNTNAYSSGYSNELGVYTLTNSSFANSDDPLCFGGYLQNGEFYTTSAIGNAVGLVHWCKVWYGDLGEAAAKELAAWTRDECVVGTTEKSSGTYPFQRYALAGEDADDPQYFGALSLHMITVPPTGHRMNSTNINSGGWNDCEMRKFLNPADSDCEDGYGRFYSGVPLALRAMVSKVQTRASIGDQSTTIKVSQDYFYIASYQENSNSSSLGAPYNDEGSYYNVFKGTADKFKVRFRGFTIPSDATYYVNSIASGELNCEVKLTDATQDPTAAANGNISVKEGDVWINNSTSLNGVNVQNRGYIYVTNETYEKYALGRNYYATSSEYIIQAEDESGYWLMSTIWWERSANVSYSTGFMNVGNGGYAGYNNTATNDNGVCPCFSIRKTA